MVGPNPGAGIKLLIHENTEVPLVRDLGNAIPPGTHAYVGIQIVQVSIEWKILLSDKCNCAFLLILHQNDKHYRPVHTVWFFLKATAFSLLHAMGCVDVNDTVHMVWLQCIFVCSIAHEWVAHPFCVIMMCDLYKTYKLQLHRVNNFTKSHVKNTITFRKHRTVWTSLTQHKNIFVAILVLILSRTFINTPPQQMGDSYHEDFVAALIGTVLHYKCVSLTQPILLGNLISNTIRRPFTTAFTRSLDN